MVCIYDILWYVVYLGVFDIFIIKKDTFCGSPNLVSMISPTQ